MLPVEKLIQIGARFGELDDLMCRPDVLADHGRLTRLMREKSELEPIVRAFGLFCEVEKKLAEDKEAMGDPELRELVVDEIPVLEAELGRITRDLELLLLPQDPNDKRNTILEIRAGEGGEEASLFAADLYRMYARYADTQGWKLEPLSISESASGGYKEVIVLVTGKEVYSQMRFEGGVHRVQRVPATETQGRIHTSTATVAVLPEADDVEVQIDENDLQISIAASGGPGGQGVNTTNSAVQIKHKPTGMIVKCQDERSQLKNKAKALKVLKSRLLDIERERQDAAISKERNSMVGTAERSSKIRTYNFPQNRVTDHRIKLTLNKLDRVIEGDLSELITGLRTHRQAELIHIASGGVGPLTVAGGDDE